jgi:hypothetical protein
VIVTRPSGGPASSPIITVWDFNGWDISNQERAQGDANTGIGGNAANRTITVQMNNNTTSVTVNFTRPVGANFSTTTVTANCTGPSGTNHMSWGDWLPANAVAPAQQTRTCAGCSEQETRTAPAAGAPVLDMFTQENRSARWNSPAQVNAWQTIYFAVQNPGTEPVTVRITISSTANWNINGWWNWNNQGAWLNNSDPNSWTMNPTGTGDRTSMTLQKTIPAGQRHGFPAAVGGTGGGTWTVTMQVV